MTSGNDEHLSERPIVSSASVAGKRDRCTFCCEPLINYTTYRAFGPIRTRSRVCGGCWTKYEESLNAHLDQR